MPRSKLPESNQLRYVLSSENNFAVQIFKATFRHTSTLPTKSHQSTYFFPLQRPRRRPINFTQFLVNVVASRTPIKPAHPRYLPYTPHSRTINFSSTDRDRSRDNPYLILHSPKPLRQSARQQSLREEKEISISLRALSRAQNTRMHNTRAEIIMRQ